MEAAAAKSKAQMSTLKRLGKKSSKGIRKQKKKRSSKLFRIQKIEKNEESATIVDPLVKQADEITVTGLESLIQDI